MRKLVALDVDGVLLDSYGHLMTTLGKDVRMLDQWSDSEINRQFGKMMKDVKWWESIPQLVPPSAITFEFDCYLTSIPEHLVEARTKNLKDLGFPIKPVIACHEKVSYCLSNNIEVMIDDKLETVEKCRIYGINGILIKPYYYSESYGKDMNPIRSILEVNSQINNRYIG